MDNWVDIIVNCLLSTVNLLPRCQRLVTGVGRAVSTLDLTKNPPTLKLRWAGLTRSSLTSWRKSRRRVKRSEHIGSIVKYNKGDYREGNRLLV